ncbi:MAG: acyl-CoA dehydrogenase family protein [Pirellulaceae bacterium]|nr:acyl-CoA dehydrogenase family protein [Pirellulaceae bacterium]
MDFQHSEKSRDFLARVQAFMEQHIDPIEADYHRQLQSLENKWVVLPIIDQLKARARAEGLWNMFLPDPQLGAGLSVTEYAPVAEATGRSSIAPEIFNCNAPDTGNMEVLYHYGSQQQKDQWLKPLLAGEIRSAFCMTEPDVASSDATNMAATATIEGDEVVVNGRKWWSTGAGHPRCKILIFMGLTNPAAHRHAQHSMVLVPMDSPGVRVVRPLSAMNMRDEPFGHCEVDFDNVRLPKSAIIAGPGRGFEIAQGRLGPGRIHHCMRLLGLAEMALKLMCQRSLNRVAFGKPLANLGGNRERIADARIMIEQARLLVLKAAWMIDHKGVFAAMSEISQIKVVCPNVAQTVIDMAIQMHGGAGVCNDFPLAAAWTAARTLRLADGPDEVHRGLVARFELAKYKS